MTTTAIRVENISKAYRLGQISSGTLSNDIKAWWAKKRGKPNPLLKIGQEEHGNQEGDILWALKDVSFSIGEGAVLGIIGRNGAGKSTLLKLLSRVTAPTDGYIKVKGRIASLLEVGTGFHPELTGRENIYLNGAILGMKRVEIDRKFDEILDFSEVEQFIDTPVKRYSSGMYVRLAFAVAAHLEPEILVVDEVLAVGDAEFQKKSLGKMGDVAQQGRTVLFVSHNMSSILRLTHEAIVLEKGCIVKRAPSSEAVDYYLSAGNSRAGERIWEDEEVPADAAPFRPLGVRICDKSGTVVETVRSIEPFSIEVEYRLSAPLTGLRIGVYIGTARGEYVLTSFDTDDEHRFEKHGIRPAGHYVSRCVIPPDLLNGGRYFLGVNASSYRVRRYFMDEQALTFNVNSSGAPGKQWIEARPGLVRPRLDWKIDEMNPKSLIKNLAGELPFSADIYWLLRHRGRTFKSRFDMEALATCLPEVMAQVKPYVESAPNGRKVFFFASWHFWIMHAALSGLTLRGLGHDVTLGYLPYSDYDKSISRFDLRRQDLYAHQVLKKTQPFLKTISLLDVRPARELPEELSKALDKVTIIDTQYIRQREDVTGTEPIYLFRKERNQEAARRALTYFNQNRPEVVIVPNGMIQEYGAIYETARFLGIPSVTYEFGEQDQRMWLGQNNPVMYYEFFNDLWKIRQDRKLNDEQRAWLENFLAARQGLSKGGNFAHVWQKASREGGAKIRATLGLDDRPVVLLPTNVLGDSATLGRTVFSRSMEDWIEKVIPFLANRPEVQLVVRIHPAETWTVGPSVAEIIRKLLPEMPAHIHLIGAKEKVNTYDLMEIADLALVYTTTAGVEMATRGIPMLVSGKATYRKRGFTIDSDSWEEYFQKLEQALVDPAARRLTQEQTERAWNYAYTYFHEYTRPFPWHLEKIMADLGKRPISYVLSQEGRREFEATFQELAGAPTNWESS